jgi:hypothetical protein
MRFGFIIAVVIFVGLLIYGSSIIENGLPSEDKIQEYIKNFREFRNTSNIELTEEQEEILSNLQGDNDIKANQIDSTDVVEIHAPVMKKLISFFEKNEEHDSSDKVGMAIYLRYLKFSKSHMQYGNLYLIAAIVIFLFSIVFNLSGIYPIASLIGRLGFFAGRVSIVIVSLAAVFFWILMKRNLWFDAGLNIFIGPVELLLGSCIALKSFDPNYPIWNRVLGSLIIPFLSSLFLIGGNTVI